MQTVNRTLRANRIIAGEAEIGKFFFGMIVARVLQLVASFFRVGIQRGLGDRLYRIFGVIG
jgi:hypothetical protein